MANVIDSLSFDNVKYSLTLPYGSCSTAAATAAKAVTVSNFNLDTGAMIAVKFTATNSASSPTLNVNSTGAKAIYYKGAAITASYLAANKTYMFVYNGTQWELLGDVDTNTTYSSKTAASGGTDVSLVTTGEKYTWNNKASTTAATQSAAGLMSAADKKKLDGIASGATANAGDITGVTAGNGLTGGATSGTATLNVGAGTGIDVAADSVSLDLDYYATDKHSGLMSAADKAKLDGIAAGATALSIGTSATTAAAGNHAHSDYVSKSSTGVQSIGGGLVVGGTSATATGKGRIMITGNTNPLIGLQAIDASGNQLTPYYIQVSNDMLYLGPTSALALSFDRSGNAASPANLSIGGSISEGGTALSSKYASKNAASQSAAGLMSAADKKKLDGVASGATALSIGTTATTAAAGNHTHTATLKNASGTAVTSLSHGGTYYLSMGGNQVSFVMPSDNNTTYGVVSTSANGLAPKSPGGTTTYLRADGTWATPPDTNTTYSTANRTTNGLMASGYYAYLMDHTHSYAASDHTHTVSIAADSGTNQLTLAHGTKYKLTAGGKSFIFTMPSDSNTTYGVVSTSANGLAPKSPGGTAKYLRADGTWATPPDTNTTYSAATQSAAGLMSANDKKKLDGIADNANNYTYTLPAATSSALGGVKVGSNITVSSGTISLTKANVTTALGYTPPTSDTNTTYSAGTGISLSGTTFSLNSGYYATSTNSGLMSAADKAKLDGIASGANNYTYTLPSATSSTLGGVKVGSNITVSSGTISLTKANVTSALGYTPPTTNTTYGVVSTSANGLAPKLPGGTTQYLRADGTWATPPDTNTTYSVVSRTANGLMASHYYAHLMDHTHNYLSNGSGDLAFSSGTGWSSFSIGRTSKNGILTLNRGSGYMDIQVASALTSNVTVYLPALGGTVYTTNNRPSAADCGAAASGHSHTSLSTLTTGTLTVNSASSSMLTVKYNNASKFRVDSNGGVYGSKYYTSGADYSEYMEWQDQNLDAEDRRGYFVTVDDCETIRIANSQDDVIGVVSSTPSVIGNDATFHWSKQYLTDIYGETLFEEVEYPETIDEEGNVIPAHTEMEPIINPEYDPTREYIPRNQRPEWAAIGMLGQLVVRDDGTCKAGKYCKCNDDGIATLAEGRNGWRVLKRLDEHHIKILFR